MIFKLLKILILIGLLVFIPSISSAETEPIYDVVACTDTTRVNPGDDLTVHVYFIGTGNTTDNFILIYFNGDITVKNAYFMGKPATEGLADKGTNVQLWRWGLSFAEDLKDIDPFYPLHPFWGRSETFSPFQFTISTSPDTTAGEHDLKVIYQYKDEEGNWHSTSDVMTFHITTEAEQIEFETLKLSFTEPYLAAFLGFLSALGVYLLGLIIDSKVIKKRREKASHKQLLSFIKKEIESNQIRSRNLNKVPKNALPTNRMEISNKDAVWPRIIEYSKRNFDLVNQISYLYDKYGLLNRTIDGGFTIFVEKNSIPEGLLDEIKRICQVIEENSNKIIKEIDQVLNS